MKLAIAVLIFSLGAAANAALVIDYTGSESRGGAAKSKIGEPAKKVLLLDQSVKWAEIVGMENCGNNLTVMGSGVDVPLSMALRMLTPSGWKVFADDEIPLETSFVTWRSGTTWTKVIADAAEANKFRVIINCNTLEVNLKSAPNLGTLAEAGPKSGNEIGEIPEATMPLQVQAQPSLPINTAVQDGYPQINSGHQASNTYPSPPEQTANRTRNEPLPFNGESAGAFLNRYADTFGYDRVAYRLKGVNIDRLLRSSVISKSSNSFSTFLRANNLLQVNGVDAVTNRSVMVITNDPMAQGRGDLLVFPVSAGLLSDNAIELAKSIGWSIGKDNKWPLDVDYKVPFDFDVVVVEPVDGFEQIFGSYPLQAQLILGSKVVNVVKRNTANRKQL